MRFKRRDAKDAFDASFEMPENYGSRGMWRYNHVAALIGMVAIPVSYGLTLLDTSTLLGKAISALGWFTIIAAAVFFIRRDRIVQRRVDETGLPLEIEEPY